MRDGDTLAAKPPAARSGKQTCAPPRFAVPYPPAEQGLGTKRANAAPGLQCPRFAATKRRLSGPIVKRAVPAHNAPADSACVARQLTEEPSPDAQSRPAPTLDRPCDRSSPCPAERCDATPPRGELPRAFQRCKPDPVPANSTSLHGCQPGDCANIPGISDKIVAVEPSMASPATWDTISKSAARASAQSCTATCYTDGVPISTHVAKLLSKLNADQLRAVLSPMHQPLLIAAGPGSGKTSAMVARVAAFLDQVRLAFITLCHVAMCTS